MVKENKKSIHETFDNNDPMIKTYYEDGKMYMSLTSNGSFNDMKVVRGINKIDLSSAELEFFKDEEGKYKRIGRITFDVCPDENDDLCVYSKIG